MQHLTYNLDEGVFLFPTGITPKQYWIAIELHWGKERERGKKTL